MERLYIGYRERIFNFWIYLVVCQELIDGFIRCHFDSSFFLLPSCPSCLSLTGRLRERGSFLIRQNLFDRLLGFAEKVFSLGLVVRS
jgi:hypothetical protein